MEATKEHLDISQFLIVGIDVHKDNHALVAANGFNQIFFEKEISNQYSDFQQIVDQIQLIARKENLRPLIALEDSYGYGQALARFFFSKGLEVKTVNPVLTRRERGYMTHPEKSDISDAKVVVKATILEGIGRLPTFRITSESEFSKDLRILVYDRDFLIKEQTRLKNQLHRLLHQSYSGYYDKIFKDPFSKKALKLWQEFPSLLELKRTKRRITKPDWLKKINTLTLLSISNLQENQIKRKVRRLLQIREELKEMDQDLEQLLSNSNQYLETLPGCARILAAGTLAEVKDVSRFNSKDAFAKYAGLSPRPWESGKKKRNKKSLSGNRRLNRIIHQIALSQIGNRGYQPAKDYFQKKIAEGKSKKQALRCLKRQISDVIYPVRSLLNSSLKLKLFSNFYNFWSF